MAQPVLRTHALPAEVWHHIFDLATEMPDPSALYIPPCRPHLIRVEWSIIKQSRRTGRSLMLVCKRWHAMAAPFLYRSIHLRGDDKSIESLWRALSRSAQEAACKPDITPLGWWTKELHIMDFMPSETPDCIKCMPNLAAVALNRPQPTVEFVAALKMTCAPSLKILIFPFHDIPSEHFIGLLSATTELRFLWSPLNMSQVLVSPLCASRMKCLAISSECWDTYEKEGDDRNRFPALEHLSYYDQGEGPGRLAHFLRVHGPTLLSLAFHETHFPQHSEDMLLIGKYCPNLVRLYLYVEVVSTAVRDLRHLPNVTILGLCTSRYETGAFPALQDALVNRPSLKIVQFWDYGSRNTIRTERQDKVQLMCKTLKGKGIRVQGPDGIDLG